MIFFPVVAVAAALTAIAAEQPPSIPPEILDGPHFSMQAAAKVCEDAAAAGRLDILSFALRHGSSPVAMTVLDPNVFAQLNKTQRATLMAEVLSDDTVWPTPDALLQRGHGPAREEFSGGDSTKSPLPYSASPPSHRSIPPQPSATP